MIKTLAKWCAWLCGYDEQPKCTNKLEVTIEDSENPRWNNNFTMEEFEKNQAEFFEALDDSKKAEKVILADASLDVEKIIEYKGEKIKKFEFRPQTWEQFIGQTEAKERAKTIIKKAKNGMKAHFLVDGIKGHGKTTYVELVAKTLNAHIIKRIGKQIDEDGLLDIINEINTSTSEFVMLFIDELDSMDWKVIKILNPIIESFEIVGKRIKPFIFAGATINKHILIKNNPDTLDRIPLHIKFSRYTAGEVGIILNQYYQQLYGYKKIDADILRILSTNCKFNPRTAIGLLEEYIVENNINKVLKNCHIVKDGLTNIDIKLLQTLNNATRPMGANALAMKVGLSQNEYLREYEPFLVEYDYINRVPSRIITEKGKEILQ
jgi:Holliday junction resolvasome RuvABC ATP-dependent DNA helicase subunit